MFFMFAKLYIFLDKNTESLKLQKNARNISFFHTVNVIRFDFWNLTAIHYWRKIKILKITFNFFTNIIIANVLLFILLN